jgi:hypothetical protein
MAALEQGLKVFSSIHKRTHRSLSKEYKKLFKLNKLYMDEEEYFVVLDRGMERGEVIGAMDYDDAGVDILPTSDPNVATEQQRLAKVQAIAELLSLGTINPQEFTKRFLEATEQPNVEALMQMPQKGPSQEELELQFKQKQHQDTMDLKHRELDIQELNAEGTFIKNIADAESKEEGSQMNEYQAIMENNRKDDMHRQKMAQVNQQAAQRGQQAEQSHQQKMRHAEQIAAQKRAQMASRGGPNGNNEGGVS